MCNGKSCIQVSQNLWVLNSRSLPTKRNRVDFPGHIPQRAIAYFVIYCVSYMVPVLLLQGSRTNQFILPGELTSQLNIDILKTYFQLKMGILHCYVCKAEWNMREKPTFTRPKQFSSTEIGKN